MPENLLVTVSLDVEEEGLFCGRYKCSGNSTRNLAWLNQIDTLIGRGVKPTLFCAWPVLTDSSARAALDRFVDKVEIGAHLHHWNTPPLAQNIPESGELHAVPASQVPLECLASKLERLLKAAKEYTGKDVISFRMGRWDLHRGTLELLAKYGIRCDASVRPLHCFKHPDEGPDHYSAPADPYWISIGDRRLLEVPLTVTPILSPLAHIPGRFTWGRRFRQSLRYWGALALLPIQHPLWLMKLAANLHANSGGHVLSLTWHSSEMMPGGAPHVPDKFTVDKFLAKLHRYLDWLESSFTVKYVTISDLLQYGNWPVARAKSACDWTVSLEA